MKQKRPGRLVLLIVEILFLCALSSNALAELVDDIIINTEANGEVNAVIKFSVPVQYLRHFPQGTAPLTSIYFNILSGVPASEWQDYETRRTPPSDLVQDITVTTRDRGTGPKVLIKFYRPAQFSVAMGSSNQVLVVHIKPVWQQRKNESLPSPGTAGVATAITALPAVAPLPPVVAPSASVPTVSSSTTKESVASKTVPQAASNAPVPARTTPVPAPIAAPPVAPAPVAAPPVVSASSVPAAPVVAAAAVAVPEPVKPVAPAGEVTAPKVVLPASSLKPIHVPLGGRDGLPEFPELEQGTVKSASETEKLSLAEQITRTNLQAARLMEKGARALLAGQTMVAVESFNNVLNLPPNNYSQDAQLWIGIARERSGQVAKAILEFNSYLKIYPDGKSADWVKNRLGRLKVSQPELFNATKPAVQARVQNTEMQYSEYGSLSMYYYQGKSRISTTALAGTVQTSSASSFSKTDQKSLMTNITMTARAYNNEYDNRLVFQGFGAKNFLPGQHSTTRLGAAYYEMKDRIVDYSAKVGVQSGFGGGVMGRFLGVAAGYGITQDMRVNIVSGQLIDFAYDAKPVFFSGSMDFGTRSPLGGSVYFINQRVNGLTDRRAIGGNLRYFEQGFNVLSVLDYDTQFKAVNIFTVQGTLLGSGSTGTDFNFLLDRRRSPILDIRNAVYGVGKSVTDLIAQGATTDQMLDWAKQRTSVTNLGQVGMTNHLNEKWLVGTDLTLSNTSGLPRSGGTDPTVSCADSSQSVAIEGCLDATPASGLAWTISERLTGMGIFQPGDVSTLGLSYTKSHLAITKAIQASNHTSLNEKWTIDTALGLSHQTGSTGNTSNNVSPMVRAGYKMRRDLTAETQLGIDLTRYTTIISNTVSGDVETTSTSIRGYVGFGFNLSF